MKVLGRQVGVLQPIGPQVEVLGEVGASKWMFFEGLGPTNGETCDFEGLRI